ncbi:MAG: FAD-dependent oxidoreductase [candidate division Zixibacteria bacterium]|nr:FAD-dependent oxidoreductase [candidate division Zixibacteria bacterium]
MLKNEFGKEIAKIMRQSSVQEYDCIIIGAGISGLMAARELVNAGKTILVLDKGRGVGGRMSTRVANNQRFDHGAQVISGTDKEFKTLIDEWCSAGVLKPVDYPTDESGAYYFCPGGIRELPIYLSKELNVKVNCRVKALRCSMNNWTVITDDKEVFKSYSVIMTSPLPQSLELLKNGDSTLPGEIAEGLSSVQYEPCIALLLNGIAKGELLNMPFVKPGGASVSLIINNSAKGVSPEPGAFTIHASREFSEKYWDFPGEETIEALLKETGYYIKYESGYLRIHRWKYSRTISSHHDRCVVAETPGLIAFAGDGFKGCDIEGAVLSGISAAQEIVRKL